MPITKKKKAGPAWIQGRLIPKTCDHATLDVYPDQPQPRIECFARGSWYTQQMSDPVQFLCNVLGMHDNSNARHSPQSILNAINEGQLVVDPDVMKTEAGADVLNKLISTVCQRGINHMNQMDESAKRTAGETLGRYEQMAERLIQAGADPWMAGRDGQSPWDLAVSRGWEGACLRFLQHPSRPSGQALGNGGTVQQRGTGREYVDSWIVAATRHDMRKVLKTLLSEATELNGVDFTGSTALHTASSVEAVEMLLEAGIDPEIRNATGKSAEERWAERTRQSGGLDSKEAKLMSLALLLKRMEHGDARTQAADMVAEAGQHMGVRDGEPLLRRAGWDDPKNALTSEGLTIFARRAEDALNRGFSHGYETDLRTSELINRIKKVTNWLNREHSCAHDQGLSRLMMWHLRARDKTKQWNGARHDEFVAFENKIKLPSDISAQEQQKAIDSLANAVSRGTICNGSYLAATALSGILAQDPSSTMLFDSHDEHDPLLIQWLDFTYRGMTDPTWKQKDSYCAYVRPDIPLDTLLSRLETQAPAADHAFWSHPQLPGLFLRLVSGLLVGEVSSSYSTPLKAQYRLTGESSLRNWKGPAKTWLERMDSRQLILEAERDPVSQQVLQVLRQIFPEVGATIDQRTIDRATEPARAPSRRRGL